MAKGSSFERLICKELSLWWSGGTRDDIFWRSSNSGGRATVRGRQGKGTFGHCGDVAAVDPIGLPLLKTVTLELKRGYSKCSVADLLDEGKGRKPTEFEGFLVQAREAAARAGTPFWMLIQRRDSKQAVVFMPIELYAKLREDEHAPAPRLNLRVALRGKPAESIIGMRWDVFLRWALPARFA